jgi:hypothetical protein
MRWYHQVLHAYRQIYEYTHEDMYVRSCEEEVKMEVAEIVYTCIQLLLVWVHVCGCMRLHVYIYIYNVQIRVCNMQAIV